MPPSPRGAPARQGWAPCRPREEGPGGLDERELQRLERLAEELLDGLAALRGPPADGPPRAGDPAAALVVAAAGQPPRARGGQGASPWGNGPHQGCQLPAPGDQGESEIGDEQIVQTLVVPRQTKSSPSRRRAAGELLEDVQMEGCLLSPSGDKGKSEIDDEQRVQHDKSKLMLQKSRSEESARSGLSNRKSLLRKLQTEEFLDQVMTGSIDRSLLIRTSCDWRYSMNLIGGIVIVVHMVCIGISTEYSLAGRDSTLLSGLEHLFLSYYVIELLVRLCADGWRTCVRDRWFIFDVVLVSMAVLSQWLVPLYVLLSGSDESVKGLEKTLVVRTLRLARPLRALRFAEGFKDMWRLVSGICRSTRTVLHACMLIFVTLYVFALLGVELVRKNDMLQEDDMTAHIVMRHFDSVFGVVLTLVQFANADSVAALYDPLIRAEPALSLYFCAVWILVTILLMNLVTAVVIQRSIELASEDAEVQARERRARLEHIVPLLKEAFDTVDGNVDGKLELDEITRLCSLPMPAELKEIMQKEKIKDLFWCLDTDENGEVSKEEFVKGMCHIALSSAPIETTQIISMLRVHGKALDQLTLMLTGPPLDASLPSPGMSRRSSKSPASPVKPRGLRPSAPSGGPGRGGGRWGMSETEGLPPPLPPPGVTERDRVEAVAERDRDRVEAVAAAPWGRWGTSETETAPRPSPTPGVTRIRL